MNNIRDFIKSVLKSVTLTFLLVDVKCKDWAAFIEISFTKFNNIKNKYTNSVSASIKICTDSDNFSQGGIHTLLRINHYRGLKNQIY